MKHIITLSFIWSIYTRSSLSKQYTQERHVRKQMYIPPNLDDTVRNENVERKDNIVKWCIWR